MSNIIVDKTVYNISKQNANKINIVQCYNGVIPFGIRMAIKPSSCDSGSKQIQYNNYYVVLHNDMQKNHDMHHWRGGGGGRGRGGCSVLQNLKIGKHLIF